jgi:hypothetical protein
MKTSIRILPGLRIVSLAMLLLIVGVQTTPAQEAKGIAVTLAVDGDVQFVRDGKTTDLPMPTVFNAGDKVLTGDNGFCAVMFTDDKSQLKIRPNSEVTLGAERNDDFSLAKKVSLEAGELFTEVTQMKGSLQIATPTAVASVKGTEFWVIFADGTTRNITLEGIVDLLSLLTGERQDVPAGMEGEVDQAGAIALRNLDVDNVPRFLDEMELQEIEVKFIDEDGNEKTLKIQVKMNNE